jgi:hypothetical protein
MKNSQAANLLKLYFFVTDAPYKFTILFFVCLWQPWRPFIAGKVGAGSTKDGKGNPKSCLG